MECCICIGDVAGDAFFLECAHPFHLACIQRWMRQSETCPTCKSPVERSGLPPRGGEEGEDALDTFVRNLERRISQNEQRLNCISDVFWNGAPIGDHNAKRLIRAMSPRHLLATVSLGGQDLSDDFAAFFGPVMKRDRCIRNLDLRNNRISDRGVCDLAVALRRNRTLKQLDLSDNHLGDVCVEALAYTLSMNTALKRLILRHNEFTDECAAALLRALGSNTTLDTIDLSGNGFTSATKERIRGARVLV